MKKLLFTLLSALALCNAQAAVVLSGSGTMDDPYLIQSDDDLNRFSSLVDEGNCNICGKLTRNITMFANFTFTPIGTSKHRFKGHFDGCGYQIIKFKLEAQGESCGMFGEVENATIKNLNIYGTMESTANNGTAIGTVVGYACGNTVIENVRSGVDMTISHSGYSHIGGIVGTLDDGVQVKRCHYSGTLNVGGNRDCIGGIVGYAYPDCWGAITDCHYDGKIITSSSSSSDTFIGGILGYTNDEDKNFGGVQYCFSNGTFEHNVSSPKYINGIVGRIRARASTTKNNFYLNTIASRACNDDCSGGIPASNISVTEAQCVSGEVTWMLNRGTSDGLWIQYVGYGRTTYFPSINMGDPVYKVAETLCDGTMVSEYSNNSNGVVHHTYEYHYTVDVEPTCTTDGKQTRHCTNYANCGKSTYSSSSLTIKALGHDYVSETTTPAYLRTAATCTEAATYWHKCSRCEDKSTKSYFTSTDDKDNALGHSWGEYTLNGDQTCADDGHKTAHCSHKGCTETNTIVATGAALGHAWGEYILEGDQTCEEDGHKTAMCTREGCTVTNTIEATGAALGHDYTSETATAPYLKSKATCIADAVYFHKCSRCESRSATTWTKEGSALGHAWGEYHLDGDQTCTYDGHKTAECTREGCSEKNKIVATGTALGHAWGEYTLDGDQTCEGDGHKTAKCTREGCSEENKIVATGAALGHDWEDFFTVDAWEDCEHAGSKSIHCHRLGCDAHQNETVIPALGHLFTEYLSNGDATTEADGHKTAECDRGCGATDTVIDEGSRIIETPTGITNVESGHSHKAIKTIEDGRVVIIRDGVRYDIAGRKL